MSTDPDHRTIGPFQLEGRLGVGGMGIVYKATYLKGGQKVALKVLAPDLMTEQKVAKRFEREMAILKKLKHPHIVKYYGGSTSGAQRYYAMELVTGGSLEERIKKHGRISWEQAVDYGIQIARALQHAHDAGVIHRDLKPANLLLANDGVIKLSDFGIARDTQATQLTAAARIRDGARSRARQGRVAGLNGQAQPPGGHDVRGRRPCACPRPVHTRSRNGRSAETRPRRGRGHV